MDAPEVGMDEARGDVWEGPAEAQQRALEGPAMDLRRAGTRLRVLAVLLFLGSAMAFLQTLGALVPFLSGMASVTWAAAGLQLIQHPAMLVCTAAAGVAALRFAGTCTPEGAAHGLGPHLEAAGRWWTLVAVGFTLWALFQVAGTVLVLTIGESAYVPSSGPDTLGGPVRFGSLDGPAAPLVALASVALAPAALRASRALQWGAWMAGLVAASIAISPIGLYIGFGRLFRDLSSDVGTGLWVALGLGTLVYVLAWCLWLVWVVWRLREHGDQVERLAASPDPAHVAAYTRGLLRATNALLGGALVVGGLVLLALVVGVAAGFYIASIGAV